MAATKLQPGTDLDSGHTLSENVSCTGIVLLCASRFQYLYLKQQPKIDHPDFVAVDNLPLWNAKSFFSRQVSRLRYNHVA